MYAATAVASTHQERVLADIRAAFSAVALCAIYVDPTQPARFAALAYALLSAYVAYSGMVAIASRALVFPTWAPVTLHVVDISVAALLTWFTDGPDSPFFMLFAFGLLTAAYRWSLWETIATGVASALAYGIETWVMTTAAWGDQFIDGEFAFNRFVIRITYLILFAAMIGYIARRQKLTADLLVELSAARERTRMSRELHDGVIQSLIGIRHRLEGLRLQSELKADNEAVLKSTEDLLTEEVIELRSIMFALADDAASGDLDVALAKLADRFEHATGIVTTFVAHGKLPQLSPRGCHELVRIAQEALVNVQKHSNAKHAAVSVSCVDAVLRVVVDDDGDGFDFNGRMTMDDLQRARRGPRMILDRAHALGAQVEIHSTKGRGAQVHILLPARF